MRKNSLLLLLSFIFLSSIVLGDDLFRVSIHSQDEADELISIGVEPILIIKDGYLALADHKQSTRLAESNLKYTFIADNVDKESIALDNRRDDKNVKRFPLLFEEDGLRLFRVDGAKAMITDDGSSLIPIRNENIVVRYKKPLNLNKAAVFQAEDLLGLIDNVSQDSVSAYLHHLQAFDGRVAGTSNNYAARDWLHDQFQSYGYTSVTNVPFWSYVYGSWKQCHNVVAYKEGSVYPDRQIVVGAHFDAVPGSPGADDNGTGTVGVLEVARALADIETDMSFVFVTFDSEEQGLNGAWDYANNAAANGDNIVCMLNMDMIGHLPNNYYAEVKYGPEIAYALLWAELSDSLVNITGYMGGSASNSDHHAFVQNGYNVLFAAEYDFSTVYHSPQDSTTHINFNYCTRMIKATLATAYSINLSPLPVQVTTIRDGGDGQSLQVNWFSEDPTDIDHYHVYFSEEPAGPFDSIIVPAQDTSLIVTGLTEGQEYSIYVLGFNASGYTSIVHTVEQGIPYTLPAMPHNYSAMPKYRSIELNWEGSNTELDFSHYVIIRDGESLPYIVNGTDFVDNDFSLGSDFHDYLVAAIDIDGNLSDTTGVEPVTMRAATLEPGRILAVNRSSRSTPYIVNEVVTGEFMRDALDGYDYVYLSDTAVVGGDDTTSVNLVDMLDYEVVILGGEAARSDDFALDPAFGGILDSIGYYLSIGGKVIMFGRWGDITINSDFVDTIFFGSSGFNGGYKYYFHMDKRVQYLSSFTATMLTSDLVGAHSQAVGYPDLVWDSLASVDHSSPWAEVSGIPCPSFGVLTGGQSEILYTYDSRSNFPLTEGKPVAWRYSGENSQYVFFEIPLSFIERSSAKLALQMALSGMLSSGPAAVCVIDPDTIDESGTPPITTTIYLGDFADGNAAGDVDQTGILINGELAPQAVSVVPSHPDFSGEVLAIEVATADFISTYGSIIDTVSKIYTLSWRYTGEPQTQIVFGQITLIGQEYMLGDANGDWLINVADAVYLINYVFKGGPAPDPVEAGDANCDGSTNVGDAVYLVNYVFSGGPPPDCD